MTSAEAAGASPLYPFALLCSTGESRSLCENEAKLSENHKCMLRQLFVVVVVYLLVLLF